MPTRLRRSAGECSMNITITVKRTSEWLTAQRLLTGENVPDMYDYTVDVSALSLDTRRFLLAYGDGGYKDRYNAFGFHSGYTWGHWASYGNRQPVIDGDVTPGMLDTAIAAMVAELAQERAEYVREKAEREARDAEEKRVKEEAAAKLTAARELLAAEIDALKDTASKREQQRTILAHFLTHVPNDALRGALESAVADGSQEAIEKLRQTVEDASPVLIFEDED